MGKLATQIPEDVFQTIARNAGVLLSEFTPSSESWSVERSKIIGATSGGINFTDTPEFIDYGENIDNCPKNTKELMEIDDREISISGTFVSANEALLKRLVAGSSASGKTITPSDVLSQDEFADLYFVFDYGNGGAICIELNNVLSTGGLSIQTADKEKGTYSFTFRAHYSISAPETVPYKIHVKEGSAE